MRFDIASSRGIDANDVKLALMQSGLVTNSPVTGASPQNVKDANLGAALIVLRQASKNWIDQATDRKTTSAPQSPVTTAAPRSDVPMPPYRGPPSVPQTPSAPSLSAATSPREQAIQLLGQTDAAIARQALLPSSRCPAIDQAAQRRATTIRRA